MHFFGLSGPLAFVAVCFLVAMTFFLVNVTAKGGKSRLDESGKSDFRSRLPFDFTYVYFHDRTGFALNPDTREVVLAVPGFMKRLPFDQIRSFEARWLAPTQYGVTSNTMMGASQQVAANRSLSWQAYSASGLFVSIADLDRPVVQILFPNENLLNVAMEMFRQAQEGVLPRKE